MFVNIKDAPCLILSVLNLGEIPTLNGKNQMIKFFSVGDSGEISDIKNEDLGIWVWIILML